MTVSGSVTIRFMKRDGTTRIRENRLYAMPEEAEAAVKELHLPWESGSVRGT